VSIRIDGLADAVANMLSSYNQDVTDDLKGEIKVVANECKNEIISNSPTLTTDYKKGWRVKKVYETTDDIRVRVFNATDYQLTHLLEYGHLTRDGVKRVAAIPHIEPAEKIASERLMRKVKIILKG